MAEVKGNSRRDKARATRRKIVHAARDEFAANGFHGATIGAIAKRAGVATQTVYFVFHTKAELMSAVIDDAVMGDDPVIPQQTEWWAAMTAARSAPEALRIFVRGSAPLFARASAMSEILRGAALTDEEVRRTHQYHEELRYTGFREVIEVVGSKGRLRKGLTAETATDVLMTLLGDSTYQLMTSERGWSHEAVVDWLCETLPLVLLGR